MTAFTWKSPEAFWLLLLVPLVGAWSVWTARNRVAALRYPVARVLDKLDKSKLLEGGASANYKEEFPPFLLAAFLCAGLELLLRSTVLRVFP